MSEYWYDNYELLTHYEESGEEESGSFAINTQNENNVDIGEYAITANIQRNTWSAMFYRTDYAVAQKTNFDQFVDYELQVAGNTKSFDDTHVGDIFYRFATHIYDNHRSSGLYKYEVYYKETSPTDGYIRVQAVEFIDLEKMYIRKVESRGKLLEENLILDDSYPANGSKNGFWWIRKGLYTIPAPLLISPENATIINKEDDEEIPYLVFELVPREENDSNLYHVRVRIGSQSDFRSYTEMFESKEDLTGWEMLDSSNWVPFPAEGVLAGTQIRIKPDTEKYEFGFYYWDATAHNPKWNYGVSVNHRMIIVLDDTGDRYVLSIDSRHYKAMRLNVSESANGELGSINIQLSNHNI